MGDTATTAPAAVVTKRRLTLGDDTSTLWVTIAASGVPLCWVVMGAALATGTWVAGGVPGGWPSVGELWRVGWMMAADGAGLDEAWLLVSKSNAVAAAAWLWLLAAAYTTVLVAVAAAVHRWRDAGWPTDALQGWLRLGGGSRPVKHFRRKDWPIPPPYSHLVPGPGVLLGQDRGRHVVAAGGTPVMVFGPTRSGKTRYVIAPNVAWWPGPVVATSVKTDLAEWTLAQRQEKGRCYGYDPTGRLWPFMEAHGITPVVWDPVRLLQGVPDRDKREHATLLAQFLTSQSSSHDAGSQGIWATLAQQYLTEVLVIADELEYPLVDALNWVMDIKGFGNDKTLPFEGMGPEGERSLRRLRVLAGKDDRFQGSVEITLKEVTGALEFTAASPTTALVPADLTTAGRGDTLFLTADHLSQTTHKPAFAAVSRYLFHVTETFRIDPDAPPPAKPLFALDELANLARLADLPAVVSTIRARAQVICGIQERSQLEQGWGVPGAKTLIGNHPVKLQLPGSSDASAMRDWAVLAGDDSDDSDSDQAATWRTIPKGHARVLAEEHPAFEIELVDPCRWLGDTPPPAAEGPEPDDDSSDTARPFDSPDPSSSGADRSDLVPVPAGVVDREPQKWHKVQAAGSDAAAAAYEAAMARRGRQPPRPHPPDGPSDATVTPLDEYRPTRPSPSEQPTADGPSVSAGNTPPSAAGGNREAAGTVPRPPLPTRPDDRDAPAGDVWLPPAVYDEAEDYWDEALAAAAREVDTGLTDDDELSSLDVFTDDDGNRYATHRFGYTIGLDDVPAYQEGV